MPRANPLLARALREAQVDLRHAGIDGVEHDGDALTEPVARARFLADEHMPRRVEGEVVVAERAHGNEKRDPAS